MEVDELKTRWNDYSERLMPSEEGGCLDEDWVFDAQDRSLPDPLPQTMSRENDKVELLAFRDFCPSEALGKLVPENRLQDELEALILSLEKKLPDEMAFECHLNSNCNIHIVKDESIRDRDVWFIGDVHGDIFAFRSALAFINSNSLRKPIYVLMGDLIDRGSYSLEVLIEVVKLLLDKPDSIFWIAGNHDGLDWDADSERFRPSADPCEFVKELNLIGNERVNRFVRKVVEIAKQLPVGLVLPNGTFVTHGGVPAPCCGPLPVRDVWPDIQSTKGEKDRKEIFKQKIKEVRHQFMWQHCCWYDPSGCGNFYSWCELENFSRFIRGTSECGIRFMIHGHDHSNCGNFGHEWASPNRLSVFKALQNIYGRQKVQEEEILIEGALTLITMFTGCGRGGSECCSVVARYRPGEKDVPQVFSMVCKVSRDEYEAVVCKSHVEVIRCMIDARLESLRDELKKLKPKLDQVPKTEGGVKDVKPEPPWKAMLREIQAERKNDQDSHGNNPTGQNTACENQGTAAGPNITCEDLNGRIQQIEADIQECEDWMQIHG